MTRYYLTQAGHPYRIRRRDGVVQAWHELVGWFTSCVTPEAIRVNHDGYFRRVSWLRVLWTMWRRRR
jgi:hypothetical protein